MYIYICMYMRMCVHVKISVCTCAMGSHEKANVVRPASSLLFLSSLLAKAVSACAGADEDQEQTSSGRSVGSCPKKVDRLTISVCSSSL